MVSVFIDTIEPANERARIHASLVEKDVTTAICHFYTQAPPVEICITTVSLFNHTQLPRIYIRNKDSDAINELIERSGFRLH